MGKNKLARWTELDSFPNVIQPSIDDIVEPCEQEENTDIRFPSGNVRVKDHSIKGRWNAEIFRNNNPVVLELGCGRGEYTTGLATKFPGKNFIGVDIKGARMWRGAKTSNELKMGNAAFLRTRIEFINSFFAGDEVDEIWITFPDPHPGARNAGKRLTSPWYLNSYRQILKDKGIIHLKTDNKELFTYTAKVVETNSFEILASTTDLYSGDVRDDILSIKTHYEQIFLRSGLKINYISFRLDKNKQVI
ncbi:MAG TPA: tRNA (guanosine(46)-N7)-methyltransferase TrmB [Bacteroidales bacterium]|nr:tRNA (guanosine(46)-N7)-methyltransferase TrmB [Bacteroidales bacterium]